jgi:hypothetical protein
VKIGFRTRQTPRWLGAAARREEVSRLDVIGKAAFVRNLAEEPEGELE